VKELGFHWFRSSRIVFIVKHDIRYVQVSYLTALEKYQEEGHQIVCAYDTYIHSGHTRYKNWCDCSALGKLASVSSGEQLIWLEVGGHTAFI
jgi:hypothetical protein